MSIMSSVIGHSAIQQFFSQAIKHDRLAHAYCLVGPEHVGKRTLINNVAGTVFDTSVDALHTVPDFYVVKQEQDEKTGKTKKNISIEQLRSFIAFFSKSAFIPNGYKVGVIEEAEKMNVNAANALLKTLEEPSKKTILFLTTSNEDALPSTILSRCQVIYFFSVSRSEITSSLMAQGIQKEQAETYAAYSRGLPGLAQQWAISEDTFLSYQKEVDRFVGFLNMPFFDKIKTAEELFGDKKDHVATRTKMYSVLQLWRILVRDVWFSQQGITDLVIHDVNVKTNWTREQVLEMEKQIMRALRYIEKNVHPRLLVEQILLCIP